MLNFYAANFVEKMAKLREIETYLESDDLAAQVAIGQAATGINELGKIAGKIGLWHLRDRAEGVHKRWQDKKLTREMALYECQEYREALTAALRNKVFKVVEERDREHYEIPLLSDCAQDAFPSAIDEMDAAQWAFVCHLYDAAVFHAMRALEFPLDSLRRRLKVGKSRETWNKLIDQIQAALEDERKRPHVKMTSQRRAKLEFYAEAAKDFRYVKDAWRNHVMHGNKNYDRDKAQSVLEHAASFTNHLSTRLRQA